MLNFFLQ